MDFNPNPDKCSTHEESRQLRWVKGKKNKTCYWKWTEVVKMLRDILQNLDKIQQNNCQLVHSLFERKYGILPRIMLSLLEHCL